MSLNLSMLSNAKLFSNSEMVDASMSSSSKLLHSRSLVISWRDLRPAVNLLLEVLGGSKARVSPMRLCVDWF